MLRTEYLFLDGKQQMLHRAVMSEEWELLSERHRQELALSSSISLRKREPSLPGRGHQAPVTAFTTGVPIPWGLFCVLD